MRTIKTLAAAGALVLAAHAGSAQDTLKMATIAPGTSAYLTMTTFASLVNQNQDSVTITVDATGAATKHGVELAQGKLDIAMGSPALINFLRNGQAMYQRLDNHAELAENQRLLMWFPYGQYHVIVYQDSGIETLARVID